MQDSSPDGEPGDRNLPAPADSESPPLASAIEQARAAVLKLGQTPWTSARPASAEAMRALANALAVAAGPNRATKQIAQIHEMAERMDQSETLSFGHSQSVKAALSGVLDGLDQLRLRPQATDVWARAARAAVSGIQDSKSMAFQRAAIQDAFRATLDALAFAAQPSTITPITQNGSKGSRKTQ